MSIIEMFIRKSIKSNPAQSMSEIARQVGRSRERVRQIIKKRNISYDWREKSRRQRTLLENAAYRNPAATVEQLAMIYGFSQSRVLDIVRGKGLANLSERETEHLQKKEMIEVFIETYPEASIARIASALGYSYNGLRNFIRREGIKYIYKVPAPLAGQKILNSLSKRR